jgi:phosphohistidine phosphatase
MVQAAPKRMRPCELYLVRHAIAAERGDDWPDDTKRPLTATGISRFEEAVDGLAWFGVDVDEIFTSPLVRAKQTADILAARLAKRPPVKILDELAPGNETARVVAELGKRVKRSRVALVGHEPDLGELAAALIGAQRALPFRKGGVCRIDVEGLGAARAGELIWFFPPKILRKASR